MFRKLLIGLAALVVLIVAALFVGPMFVPKDWLRKQITAQVKDATGRDLTIAGDLELQLLPEAIIKLGDVKFSNMADGSRPDMATLQELSVHVALLPLISKEIEVKEFVLVKPNILLEVDKNGKANWAISPGGDASASGSPSTSDDGDGAGLESLKLGDVRVVDGRVEYKDAKGGTSEVIENLNVSISLPDLDSPLAIDGSLSWHQEALTLKLGVAKPRALMEAAASPLSLTLNGKPVNVAFNGSLDTGALGAGGKLALDVPSIKNLAAWAASPLDVEGDVLGPLKIDGQLAVSPSTISFTDMTLVLDAVRGTGSLSAKPGTIPSITGKLALEALDLNPYLTAFGGDPNVAAAPAKPAGTGWSDEPIDVSALRTINADLALSVASIQAQDIKIGESAVAVKLNGGKLNVNLSKLAFYGGNGTATINVDASGKVPAVSKTFKLSGVQARPMLTDAAQTDWLAGTGNIVLDVTTRGTSQKAMVSALNGKGNFSFLDGSIYGINLASMVRNATGAFLTKDAGPVKTDFAELSGSFTIKNGLVSNDDLKMLSPLLRVSGKGTADMPPRTVNYRLEPKAVASLSGQGGVADKAGITVPIIVEGSWDNPSFRPDLTGAISDLAKDPAKALDAVKGLAKEPGKILDNAKDLAKDPGSALKTLVPGGEGGKSIIPGLSKPKAPVAAPKSAAPSVAPPKTATPAPAAPSAPADNLEDATGDIKKLFGE
jgi:AsmA protein